MNKIYVTNLPENYSKENVNILFKIFGEITSIKVWYTIQPSKSSAIIEFKDASSVEQALKALQNKTLYNCSAPLFLQHAIMRNKKLFVGNLPLKINRKKVLDFFSVYGKIESVKILDNGSSTKACAFVAFENEDDAKKCVDECNGKIKFESSDNYLLVRIAESEREKRSRAKLTGRMDEDDGEKCVFVYNLPKDYEEHDLIQLFAPYGIIKNAKVVDGCRGLVNFSDSVSALKSVKHMDGKKVVGKKINVTLRKSKR